jgi:hypothetical protein
MSIPRSLNTRLKPLMTAPPRLEGAYDKWILQEDIPLFLKDNSTSDEIIIKLSPPNGP